MLPDCHFKADYAHPRKVSHMTGPRLVHQTRVYPKDSTWYHHFKKDDKGNIAIDKDVSGWVGQGCGFGGDMLHWDCCPLLLLWGTDIRASYRGGVALEFSLPRKSFPPPADFLKIKSSCPSGRHNSIPHNVNLAVKKSIKQ